MTDNSVITNLNLDGGRIIFNQDVQGELTSIALTVAGNFQGTGGYLRMESVLGDDDSSADRLLVKGNTSGNTIVEVVNFGGQRNLTTLNGIGLITVNGNSDGSFIQSDRIVAGAYHYFLGRGEDENDKNGYLTSQLPKPDPKPDLNPTLNRFLTANL